MSTALHNTSSIEQPLVTVITVTYNSSAYIRDAIESVLAQTYTNIEYIIGDDCSTDNTWNIIQEYKDPRIIAYRNEVNLREYPNRNKAIEKANGKYLIFIDGDDVIFPHGISFFTGMMEKFPQAAMAIQKGYINNILFPLLLQPEETLCNHYFGKSDLLSSSFTSDFFKTDVFKETGKLKTDIISGDNEIRVRIAAQYPILLVAGWVSWPRETPGQASSAIKIETHLAETYSYTKAMLAHKPHIAPELHSEIELTVKKSIARFCLRCIAKLQPGKAAGLLKRTGMSWTEVFKYYNIKIARQDILQSYSPAKPIKRNFLKA